MIDAADPLKLIEDYIQHGGIVKGNIKSYFFDDCEQIPDPSELNASAKNLLILDDCLLEKQNKAESYYTRGHHNNCDTFYISQNYFRLPRQTIRENANFIMLFPQDNILHILHIFMLIIVAMIWILVNLKHYVIVYGIRSSSRKRHHITL